MHLETLVVRAGAEPDRETGAVAPPLHLSTTFEHAPDGAPRAGYEYVRGPNPTQDRLEAALAALDGGAKALAFASGMAAAHHLLADTPAGGHVVLGEDLYHGVRALTAELLPHLTFTAVDTADTDAVARALTPATRWVWCETPSNPRCRVADIAALASLAHARGAALLVDGTFALPVLQRPLSLGADVVLHSTTKFIAGHSDALGGALVFAAADARAARIERRRYLCGAVLSPFNAWLTLRGLRSLAARVAWQCASARAIAHALEAHPRIERVWYPGLPGDEGHARAARQMRDFGAMMSLSVRGGRDEALRFAGALRLITNATSLGGVESLIEHRASVEGAYKTSPENLLRLSVGLEAAGDLIDDLRAALDAV